MISKEEEKVIEIVLKTIELQGVVNSDSDVEILKEMVNSQQGLLNAYANDVEKIKEHLLNTDKVLQLLISEPIASKQEAGEHGKKRGTYKKKQQKHVVTNERFLGFTTNAKYLAKVDKMLTSSKNYTADEIEKEIFKKHPDVSGFSGKDMIREIKQARWRLWYHNNKKKQPKRDPAIVAPF